MVAKGERLNLTIITLERSFALLKMTLFTSLQYLIPQIEIYTRSTNNYLRLTPQKRFEVKEFTYLIKSIWGKSIVYCV